jgi:hypothetical protein
MKKQISKIILSIFAATLLIPGALAADSGIEVDATDTVAGYGTLIRISNAAPNSTVELILEKPDGSHVILDAETGSAGVAKTDIAGFYTKKTGDYEVYVQSVNGEKSISQPETFTVYADSVSSSRSLMEISDQTASANGNDYITLKVHLYDRYNNAIQGHTVDMLSSRLTDEIVRISSKPYTNELGTMQFNVYSKEEGVSTFLAHDSTEGVTLNDRARIAFYEPSGINQEMGGNVFLSSTEDSGPVSYLMISDIGETVSVNSTQNFTVTAYDDDGNNASDYTGTVRFSSSDNNSTLPDDYQFEAEDQGSHTFSLSLSFKTEGTQTLTVTDTDQFDIYGETSVEVGASETGSSTQTSTTTTGSEDLSIFTPIGGTYSSSSLTFTGEATYGLNVIIYDGSEMIGETSVNADGSFSHSLSGLEDGNHRYVVTTETPEGAVQETATDINITIDTTPPDLDHSEITPEGDIASGESFGVTAYAEPDLPEVSLIFNGALYELTENVSYSGMYEGALTAPDLGEYDIDIILVDEIGNEISYDAELTVNVIEAVIEELEVAEDDDLHEAAEEEEEVEEEIINYPGQVTGVEAVAGDGRVTLTWQAPEAVITETEYQAWVTLQETPEGASIDCNDDLTCFETSLAACHPTTYELNMLSAIFDTTITEEGEDCIVNHFFSSAPEELIEYEGLSFDCAFNKEELATNIDLYNDAINSATESCSGPYIDAVNETLAQYNSDFVQANINVNVVEDEKEASPTINHYRIYYGPSSELLVNSVDTLDTSTTWYVPELFNGATYYFSVHAVDSEGNESLQKSTLVSGAPEAEEVVAIQEAEMQKEEEEQIEEAGRGAIETATEEEEIPTDTGPEVAWLILLSIGFAQAYNYFRKRGQTIIVPIHDIK